MICLMFSLMLAGAIAVTSTTAMARSRHQDPPNRHAPATSLYNPTNDPNAVFVGGTYVGSDPDPRIRASLQALGRKFPQ
jgi:hypothetical protein